MDGHGRCRRTPRCGLGPQPGSYAVREDAACVLGGVVISAEPSTAWHRFQRLEFAVMQTWIAGGVQSGRLAMGSGANSLYATADYPADALQPEWASGDDAFALLALRQADKAIQWCGGSDARHYFGRAQLESPMATARPVGLQDRRSRCRNPTNRPHHCGRPCRPGRIGHRRLVTDGTTGWRMLVGFVAAKALVDWRLLALAGREFGITWHAERCGAVPVSLCRFGVGSVVATSARWRSVEGPPD